MTEIGIVKYDITDAAIAEMGRLYMCLTIDSLDDKEQFDAVHSARMVVKGKRIDVEKRRKELKADALVWGRKVDAKAKEIFSKLSPIEGHLQDEEDKVINEKKRVEAEKAEAARTIVKGRVDQLMEYDMPMSFEAAGALSDDGFNDVLDLSRITYESKTREAERVEEVRKAQAAEAERLSMETASLEAEKKAEQERRDREAFERQAEENARLKAEADAKEKVKREAVEKEAVENERLRQERLRPDTEKMTAFADELIRIRYPEVSDPAVRAILTIALQTVCNAGRQVLSDLSNLEKEAA